MKMQKFIRKIIFFSLISFLKSEPATSPSAFNVLMGSAQLAKPVDTEKSKNDGNEMITVLPENLKKFKLFMAALSFKMIEPVVKEFCRRNDYQLSRVQRNLIDFGTVIPEVLVVNHYGISYREVFRINLLYWSFAKGMFDSCGRSQWMQSLRLPLNDDAIDIDDSPNNVVRVIRWDSMLTDNVFYFTFKTMRAFLLLSCGLDVAKKVSSMTKNVVFKVVV